MQRGGGTRASTGASTGASGAGAEASTTMDGQQGVTTMSVGIGASQGTAVAIEHYLRPEMYGINNAHIVVFG